MKRVFISALIFGLLSLLFSLSGCGGGASAAPPSPTPTPTVVSVSITPLGPTTIRHGQTLEFNAAVENDSGHKGVAWTVSGSTCTGNDCGAMTYTEPLHAHYTAPAPLAASLTVTVRATSLTDSMKSASATLTVIPPPDIIAPPQVQGMVGVPYNLMMEATGGIGALHWSLLDGTLPPGLGLDPNTGTISGTPTTPGQVSFTVQVSDSADPPMLAHEFLSIVVQPAGLFITTAALPVASLANTYAYPLEVTGGVPPYNWEIVGSLPPDLVLNGNSIQGTATTEGSYDFAIRVTDSAETIATKEFNLTVSAAPLLKPGDYAFAFSGWEINYPLMGFPTPDPVVVAGHFHVDGAGNITSGVQDIQSSWSGGVELPFTGTYSIASDRKGTFQVTGTGAPATWVVAVDASGEKGSFVKFEVIENMWTYRTSAGTGYFELQDNTAFSLPALAGDYALGMSGGMQIYHLGGVGQFTVDDAGILNGKMDMKSGGVESPALNLTLTGSLGAPSPMSGRGTATLNVSPAPSWANGTMEFVYYVVSPQKVLLASTGIMTSNIPVATGELRRQSGPFSPASLNTAAVFSLLGATDPVWPFEPSLAAAVGQISPSGPGLLTGIVDENQAGELATNHPFTGTYSMEANGRCTITAVPATGEPRNQIAYFFAPNEAFLIQAEGPYALYGRLKPQSFPPFSAASAVGTYMTSTGPPPSEVAWNYTGSTAFDGVNAVTSSLSSHNYVQNTGMYSVAANGRGTMTIDSDGLLIFWVVSPDELVGISTSNAWDTHPNIVSYRK